MFYPTSGGKAVTLSVSHGRDSLKPCASVGAGLSGWWQPLRQTPPTALCRTLRGASGSCTPHMQDAKAGRRHDHVSAAERGSGSLSIQRLCGILSRLGKFPLLGVRAGPHFCGSDQQRRLPGQQPVCRAGVDQGAVPGRLRLPCGPQCRWASLKGVRNTAAAPCPAHAKWLPPLCFASESRSTSHWCLHVSLLHKQDV